MAAAADRGWAGVQIPTLGALKAPTSLNLSKAGTQAWKEIRRRLFADPGAAFGQLAKDLPSVPAAERSRLEVEVNYLRPHAKAQARRHEAAERVLRPFAKVFAEGVPTLLAMQGKGDGYTGLPLKTAGAKKVWPEAKRIADREKRSVPTAQIVAMACKDAGVGQADVEKEMDLLTMGIRWIQKSKGLA